jgi:hypothetical protein
LALFNSLLGWGPGNGYLAVKFPGVIVATNQTLTIAVLPGSGFSILSGLQMEAALPVTVVTPPTNQTVLVNSNGTLSVAALGVMPLSYQWIYNGTNITGATNSAFTVGNAQPPNAGVYTVVIGSGNGAGTSASASLSIVTAATVVSEPASQTVVLGSNATFSVAVGGAGPVEYQWLFDGSPAPGATNRSFILTNAQWTDAGSYSVVVSNNISSVTSAIATLIVLPPVQTLIDVAFTDAAITPKTGFAATGMTAADYWNTCSFPALSLSNLRFVDGTYSGAGLTVSNVSGAYTDGAPDPMYASYYYTGGNFVSAGNQIVTITNLAAGVYDFYFYGHGNGNNQNSAYELLVDSQDYGIEMTTNGAGWQAAVWQEGLQYVEFANIGVSAGQSVAVIIHPQASTFADLSGFQLATVNQPAVPILVIPPVSQEVPRGSNAAFSILVSGGAPLTYQWMFNGGAISSATNSSYFITNAQLANVGIYSVIVTNGSGSVTCTNAGLNVVTPVSSVIDVAFTGASNTSKTGFAATGVSGSDFWNTCIVTNGGAAGLKYANGNPSFAGVTIGSYVGIYNNGTTDPMYETFVYSGGNITVTVTNLPAATYNVYLYGHGDLQNENSSFRVSVGAQNYGTLTTSNGTGWLSPIWQRGVHFVEFTNVSVAALQTLAITVLPAPGGTAFSGFQIVPVGPASPATIIVVGPADTTVPPGSNAVFSVLPTGAPPFGFQWMLNGISISGATNGSLVISDAQLTDAGNYSVIVSNAYNSVTSAVAALNVVTPVSNLIDVAFSGIYPTLKMGFAATGVSTNDFWNTIYSSSIPDLKYVNGSNSGANLTLVWGGTGANGASDPMYGNYVYAQGGNMTMTISGLPPASYDLYLYGHGFADAINSTFDVSVGSRDYGAQTTTQYASWLSDVWKEGIQYVRFTNVSVSVGETLTNLIKPGPTSPYAIISGLQMNPVGAPVPPPPVPVIITQPSDQTTAVGSVATFSVISSGGPPLAGC